LLKQNEFIKGIKEKMLVLISRVRLGRSDQKIKDFSKNVFHPSPPHTQKKIFLKSLNLNKKIYA